ncbi:MAG: cupredoxin domain-containing protein [Chloroflexota bacterium]|nr:cupredoxin domain-containing protein [Chloroflexota bacterium]
MRYRRLTILIGALFVLALLVAGCGDDDDDGDDAGDDAGTTPAASAQTIDVTLTEFQIEMPSTIQAGPVSFVVTNEGNGTHNFEIEGEGIEAVLEANLAGGETQTLEVDLQPGTYTIICPVGNHEEQGMTTEVTVE